jgi:diadenosine tetraphosphate (Ap4A) HIT family hydrolase
MRKENCPFCEKIKNKDYVLKVRDFYILEDAYPVTPGHKLVVSDRHIESFYALDQDELHQLGYVIEMATLQQADADGFNIGFNEGEAAGKTVPHFHIHIIPRSFGDTEEPTGGVRNVIPGKGSYEK